MSSDTVTKIVLIGAGSREFSRGVIHDLILAQDLQQHGLVDVVLVDINEAALEAMYEYAVRCAKAYGLNNIRFSRTVEREKALPRADFVLLCIAINRMDLWEQDFRVPLSYGIRHIYGENGGPGALFHALRNFKILSPICADIEGFCPEAIVLNFTNPEARILTFLLTTTRLNAYGLCHGFYSFRTTAAKVLARKDEELDIRTAGMNHFYTFYKIDDLGTGEDLIPEFSRRLNESIDSMEPLNRYLWQNFGVCGYASDLHIGEYVSFADEFAGCRWEFGVENRPISSAAGRVDPRTAFEAWGHGMEVHQFLNSDIPEREKRELTDESHFERGSVQRSGELAVPIIADIVLDRRSWRPAINALNSESFITNLSVDGCIEVPATVDADGIHPEHVGELPEGFAAMIRTQHSIQKLLVQAYVEKSQKLLLQALLLDPVVRSAGAAEQVLNTMLNLQKEYLPDFSCCSYA